MNDDLRACPFCGSTDVHVHGGRRVRCGGCGVVVQGGLDEEGLRRCWNRRAGDPAPGDDLAEHPAWPVDIPLGPVLDQLVADGRLPTARVGDFRRLTVDLRGGRLHVTLHRRGYMKSIHRWSTVPPGDHGPTEAVRRLTERCTGRGSHVLDVVHTALVHHGGWLAARMARGDDDDE